MYWFYFTIFN